jgi:hypothetical protein
MNEEQKTDAFLDDENVPFETIVCYSKREADGNIRFLAFLLLASFIVLGLIFSFKFLPFNIILSFIVVFLSSKLYESYKHYQDTIKQKPQIIINENGLQTIKTKFQTWDKIEYIEVISDDMNENNDFLVYKYENGQEKLYTSHIYDISQEELKQIIEVYQGRFKKNNPEKLFKQITFFDDENVPSERKVFYSLKTTFIPLLFWFLFACISVGGLITTILKFPTKDNAEFFLVCSLFSIISLPIIYSCYTLFYKARKKDTQMILNMEGLYTIKTNFVSWNEIENEKIYKEEDNDKTEYYLIYEYKQEKIILEYSDKYDISTIKLNTLLKIYRGRFEQQQRNQKLGL